MATAKLVLESAINALTRRTLVVANLLGKLKAEIFESPQMRVGSGGASSMPPQQRNSIEINAPGEWKP